MRHARGFTLIELLVVIAIIGLLSSVVLASLGSTRTRSADVKRAATMKQIQNAVEIYNIANGHYPNSNGAWSSFDSPAYNAVDIISPNAIDLTTALAPYIDKVVDARSAELGSDAGYLYISNANADSYCILVYRVPQDMRNFSSSLIPPRCGTVNASGQCSSGANAIYTGAGIYAGGC